MYIELSERELEELLYIGEEALRDLRVEVRRTSTPNFHDALVIRREQLDHALDKLRVARTVEKG